MAAPSAADGTALMHLPTVMTLLREMTLKTQDAEAVKQENKELKRELERLRNGHSVTSMVVQSKCEGGSISQPTGALNASNGPAPPPVSSSSLGADSTRLHALGMAQERGHAEYEEMKRELEEYKQKYHRELHANEERVQRVVKLDADRVRLEDEVKRLRADAEGLKLQLKGFEDVRQKNEELSKSIEKLIREKDALVLELAISQQEVEDLARLTDAGLREENDRLKHDLNAKDAQLKHFRERIESMQQSVHRRRDSMSSTTTARHRSQPPVGRVPAPDVPPPVPPLPRPASMMVAGSSEAQKLPRPSSMSAIPGVVTPRRAGHRSTKSQHSPGSIVTQTRTTHGHGARPLADVLGFGNERVKGKGKEKAVSVKEEDEVIEIPDGEVVTPTQGPRSVMPEERRKALDEFPQIVVDLSEETMQQNAFSRTQLQSVLGGNKQALIARIAAERRGDKKVAAKHGVVVYLCPGLELNPWCPDTPGKHGYMFVGLGQDAGTFTQEETCPLFVTVAPQRCMYMGTYQAKRVQDLTPEEWWAMDANFKESYVLVTAKKTGQPQSSAKQIRADYDSGVLRVPCVRLICVGFENDFVQDILNALQLQLPTPTSTPSAKVRGKRRRDAVEDDDAYEGDVGEPVTPLPLRKSPRKHV
ncbi:uncharacterized protein SCHCODRAFT_02609791 [Schizophyllum commune H4-8]|uniref:uncharacterized protein n=1 Tax=Schizophyllum commune (strain H4-8 / FGSC 9210) TaxID=578458 RepID=UPI0021604F5D|nr:uncharacterized protein SCHCODRAFT_02609791 [Schizophyllum commune H4-8]KAI5897611.1 hypothetical protein SCHCODRAFT_02609791 [Schizophyllum commune H4-8]